VAYVVTDRESISEGELQVHVRRRLPDHMVPARVVVLDEFPLSSAGKVDRGALPDPGRRVRESTPLETDTEREVTTIFETVLGGGTFGADSDFFDVGGNSLTASRVVSGIRDELGVTLALSDVFTARTIASLAALVDAAKPDAAQPAAAVPVTVPPRPTRIPLTSAQSRMWVHSRLDPESGAYNIVAPSTVPQRVDAAAMRRALADVVERHEALRTLYPDDAEGPFQFVLPAVEAASSLAEVVVELAPTDDPIPAATRAFDLGRSLPIRVVLQPLSDDETRIVLVVHHIAADGWSMGVLSSDLLHAYTEHRAGRTARWDASARSFVDAMLVRSARLGSPEDPESRSAQNHRYWLQTLHEAPTVSAIPGDRPRPPVPTHRGGAVGASVSRADLARLTTLAGDAGTGLFAMLHSALVTVLARSGAGMDVVVGVPTAGRDDAETDTAVGMFVGMVPMRSRYEPLLSGAAAARQSSTTLLAALTHRDVELDRVIDELGIERDTAVHPVFSVTLDFDESPRPASATISVDDMDVATARFDMEFTVSRAGDGLEIRLVFASDLYDTSTARRVLDRYTAVLRAMGRSPNQPLRTVDLDDTVEPAPSTAQLPPLVLSDILCTAGDVVDGDDGTVHSVVGIATSARRLARLLLDRGVGPEDVVALALPRSVSTVVAVHAVAMTGAAFLPVDPALPADRVTYMLTDSGARLVVTTRALLGDGHEGLPTLILDDDRTAELLRRQPTTPIDADELRCAVHVDQCAYLIYTSGSTGMPKAVTTTHRGLAAFADEQFRRYGARSHHRTLQFASPSFDASILELLMAARSGATMVVAPGGVFGGDELAGLLARFRITHAFLTPGALETISDEHALPDLHTVVVGGDACPPALAQRWIRRGTAVFNAYGPTEATIMATVAGPLSASDVRSWVPIGRPIVDTTVRILDASLGRTPTGVPGEMYISGGALARGYLNRPSLTAASFVADPDGAPGSRRYRTGDLARWSGRDAEPALEHCGRADFQVKIRGHRVEIGEIETAVRTLAGVTGCVVTVRGDLLVAYVQGAAGDPDHVIDHLRERLPSYMIPQSVTPIDRIPLTTSGKVDHRSLPEPTRRTRQFVSPRGDNEIALADIVGEVLGLDRVGATDNFFEVGGNSLSATRVVSRVRRATGRDIAVRDLFDAPTVRALAVRVGAAGMVSEAEVGSLERPAVLPLSPAQQRMWFLNRLDPSSTTENVPVVVKLTGNLDLAAFQAALTDLVERHEALRTVYPDSVNGPHQVVLDPRDAAVKVFPQLVSTAALSRSVEAVVHTVFDVTAAPPLRVELFAVDDADEVSVHLCALVIHHISADGVSVVRLAAELAEAYGARRAGIAPAWEPLRVQYADFALWQRRLLDADGTRAAVEKDYWTARLGGAPSVLELPTDRMRPARRSGHGRRVSFALDAATHRAMAELAAAQDASVFMVAHAAFAILLGRLGGTSDVVIGTPVAGRGHEDLDGVVGMFVNMLALRSILPPSLTGAEAVQHVREVDLDSFERSQTPFDRVVEYLDPPRSRAHHPIFQVALSFQNIGLAAVELDGLQVDIVDADTEIAEFDLHLTLVDTRDEHGREGPVDASISYSTDLFDEHTVEIIAERFRRIVDALVSEPDHSIGSYDPTVSSDVVRTEAVVGPASRTTLADAFVAAVDRYPDAVVLRTDGKSITYRTFASRVFATARRLIDLGVGPETTVALAIPRGLDQVVAMYAVVMAGGAYVPVDGATDRVRTILEAARPVVVLSAGSGVVPAYDAPVLDVATVVGDGCEPVTDAERSAPLRPQHPAYVLFTSGSTGVPKGVSVSHGAVCEQLAWMQTRYPLGEDDGVLVKTSAGFDLSVWEYWWAPQVGARIALAPVGAEYDTDAVASVIQDESITVLCTVPSSLAMLTRQGSFPGSIRRILCIGEELSPELCATVLALSSAEMHNLYGPTEATVSVTGHDVRDLVQSVQSVQSIQSRVPIGRQQPAVGVAVLDAALSPVVGSAVGEMYISGPQLARGYHGDPGRTATSFVADPHTGARMYRTGDLVRRRTDGALDYVGRSDSQIKIRGFRIEIGEVESAMRSVRGIADAAVVAADLGTDRARLAAYYVAAGTSPGERVVRETVRDRLPAYMVPSTFTELSVLPRGVTGKVDRARLPRPEPVRRQYVAPRTSTETAVCRIVAEVTGTDRAGIEDGFFELGGNSLAATSVASRIEQVVSIHVPVRIIFDTDTLGELARAVDAMVDTDGGARAVPMRRSNDATNVPLAPAQERIWDWSTSRRTQDWNVPLALRLVGDLDVDAVREAIGDLVSAHDALRTVHARTDTGAVLEVLDAQRAIPEIDVVHVVERDLPSELARAAREPIDLLIRTPVRVRLFDCGASTHVLTVVVHHIVADGRAMAVLMRDMLTAFASRASGTPPTLATGPLEYVDYAAWRHHVLGDPADPASEFARQIRHWTRVLAREAQRPRLRTDRPRPDVWESDGGAVEFRVEPSLHAVLEQRARSAGAGLFVVLQAAFVVLLADRADDADVTVATSNANRPHPDLSDIVGNFAEDLPMRIDVDDRRSFSDIVAAVRTSLADALAHPDVSAPRLVEALGLPVSAAEHPIFPAMLIVQPAADIADSITLGGVDIDRVPIDDVVAKHELEITITEHRGHGGLTGTLLYPRALFDESTAQSIADGYLAVLRAVTDHGDPTVEDLRGVL
jgi:amino acid adenylation domain-containing protein